MNCLECQDLLQRRLDGLAEGEGALEQHLSECVSCRELYAAAARLRQGLLVLARPVPSAALTRRIVAAVGRDRALRQRGVRRRLFATAALVACVLLMLVAGYYSQPRLTPEAPRPNAPLAEKQPAPTKPAPPTPEPVVVEKQAHPTLAALSQHAQVLLTATNPLDGVPMGGLPGVTDPLAATDSLKQAGLEVSEGVETVTRSARQAFDYFSREIPSAVGSGQ